MNDFMVVTSILLFINGLGESAAGPKKLVAPIKLYFLPPSPPCRAVMLTASVLGVELELIAVNILDNEHKTPEYLKMNPQHTIPTMDDNGFILWESRAIQAYLVNAYGKNDALYPKNPRLRAIIDQRLNFDLGTLSRRWIDLYVPMLIKGEPFDDEKGEKLNEALELLNIFLEGHAFVAGENMSIADLSIVVIISNLDAVEYDLSSYDNVRKWFERMKIALKPYDYEDIDQTGAEILASFINKDDE